MSAVGEVPNRREAEKLMDLEAGSPRPAPPRPAAHRAFGWGLPGVHPKIAISRKVCDMVEGVKALGMETCVTLGMLTDEAGEATEELRTRLLQP